jgi:hypothetical protein
VIGTGRCHKFTPIIISRRNLQLKKRLSYLRRAAVSESVSASVWAQPEVLFLLMSGAGKKVLAASAVLISCAALLAFVFDEGSNKISRPDELLSPLEVGLYAVRAERESEDYDKKAERQIAFATDNDNAATSERQLAAKEEKRARESAYLAADIKSRIDKVLEDGRDQVCAAMVEVSGRLFSLIPGKNTRFSECKVTPGQSSDKTESKSWDSHSRERSAFGAGQDGQG